eukprot:scaffold323549_cov14-Tisochrysis_lutea.AAC.1
MILCWPLAGSERLCNAQWCHAERRYNGAIEEKVQVMQERDEARDEVAALQSKRDVSSRQQITVGAK